MKVAGYVGIMEWYRAHGEMRKGNINFSRCKKILRRKERGTILNNSKNHRVRKSY
jgi:hypothetical protein